MGKHADGSRRRGLNPARTTTRQTFGSSLADKMAGGKPVLGSPFRDIGPRWRPGERLDQLFEDRCDRLLAAGLGRQPAVETEDALVTFGDLDGRANRLARHLIARGVRSGDRVALLFEHPVHSYIGMLAVLKARAAYVPLDPGSAPATISHIVADAGVSMVLTLAELAQRLLPEFAAPVVCLDLEDREVIGRSPARLTRQERGDPVDELACILYPPVPIPRPTGLAVEHASICNFARVACDVYGFGPGDRIYQGTTAASPSTVDEVWVPLLAGSTVVPEPSGNELSGPGFTDFLRRKRITGLYCDPARLSALGKLPGLRILIASEDVWPAELVGRWHRPGLRFLHVYGPAEATGRATCCVVVPGRPVTLGVPLPTYSVVILDPVESEALAPGELGEIGLAGIGLARGYIHRRDLTDKAFIPDFLGIEDNPSRRIYRTGDLGRINDDREVEYHGSIDMQVKIRGRRIELTAIESALTHIPGIATAVVKAFESCQGSLELVAYYTLGPEGAGVTAQDIRDALRDRLPGHMEPAFLERLEFIPLTQRGTVDRNSLPAPPLPGTPDPGSDTIGADTTIPAGATVFEGDGQKNADAPVPPADAAKPVEPARANQYLLRGALQLLAAVAYVCLLAAIPVSEEGWVAMARAPVDVLDRAAAVGAESVLAMFIAPILLKWVLIGRWTVREIPLRSPGYVRFWAVKTLVTLNPVRLFVGTPLYPLYLKALGARIGKRVAILSAHMPVCTDLLRVGDNTLICKEATFNCYRASAEAIQTGPVTLGSNVLVGDHAVFDIDTGMEDNSRLVPASFLHRFQTVPAGRTWHGSPARDAG